MIYKTNDGAVLRAGTTADLVRQLHELSHAPAESDAAWMMQTAKRTAKQTGQKIRYGNPRQFIADLLRLKLITREDAQ